MPTLPDKLFRTLAEYTYDWETWIDGAGVARWVNPAVERITGYTVDECLGMPGYPLPLAHPGDRALLASVLDEAARGTSGNDVEFRIVRKDGAVCWVAISFQEVRDASGAGQGYRTSVRDIDERKRMEQELHVMRRRAEAAAIARSELLANVSHELRTPAHCIAGFAELLLASELDPVRRRHVELIADQCDAMLRQVEDLLEVAALEAGGVRLSREPFDLHQLVQLLEDAERPTAEARGLTLVCERQGAPRWVEGDPHRLRQVLRNLLDNAVKFTEQGTVQLRVAAEPGERVQFTVADTGVGFDPRHLERLLAPFEQGDASATRRRGGAGLGLAICRRLVEAMAGQLDIHSEPGRGTTVRVTLPLPGTEPRGNEAEVTAASRAGHALVVDDSGAARELLVGMLALLGWSASEADSGAAALELAAREHFDAVLLDYQMPGSDGAETAVALRRLFAARHPERRVPILLLTANVFVREQLSEAREAIDAILAKPLSRTALAALLRGSASTVEVLDARVVSDLESTMGRDGRSMLARLLPRVQAELEAALTELRSGPHEQRARAAHSVAGQAALVGAHQAAALARALEDDLSAGALEPDDVERRIEALDAAWRDAERALRQRVQR
jgi:PAS domain S-box-containing protein